MSTSEQSNKAGIRIFGVVFVATLVLFAVVMVINKGPIDKTMWEEGPTFTAEEKAARDQEWRKSTSEAVQAGQKLYEINIFGPRAAVFEEVLAGKHGSSEVEVYRILTHGIPKTQLTRMDFLPQSVRWQMVHYIRSKISNPASASAADWSALDEEGI